MGKNCLIVPQITQGKNLPALLGIDEGNDFLKIWMELYFDIEVTTLPSSRKIQGRDLDLFISFMIAEEGTDIRSRWPPRLSAAFKNHLISVYEENKKKRRWSDKTANRILAHVKTWAKWVHKLAPFPLGNPMEKIKSVPVGHSLDIDRAVTPSERRRILDAADRLPVTGRRSRDRSRYKGVPVTDRPVRKNFRPFRNRAMVYTLMETGMRREAVIRINLADVDFMAGTIAVQEKGRVVQTYSISQEGLMAIEDYIEKEREGDAAAWRSPVLFARAWPCSTKAGNGNLSPWSVNQVWNQVCEEAGIDARRTPHCARHAMGKHIMDKTGNLAAVQRQLGHKNAAYSMQYARVSKDEMKLILEDR